MSEATVLIADDHPIFRQGVRHLIEQHDSLSIVAEANDGQSAIQLIRLHQPDLVILDLFMPNIDGLGVLEWTRENHPQAACVILTMQTDAELIERAIELGARGYLFKEDAYDQLHHCMDAVLAGKTYTSPSLASPAILQSPIDGEVLQRISLLTRTQLLLLQLLGEFKTSREIAELMNISHRTVQNHRVNICAALDMEGSGKLLEFAVRHQAEIRQLRKLG